MQTEDCWELDSAMNDISRRLAVMALAFEAITEGPQGQYGDFREDVASYALFEMEAEIQALYVFSMEAKGSRPEAEYKAMAERARAEKERKESGHTEQPEPAPPSDEGHAGTVAT